MRKETICISEHKLMFVIGGQLFDQAPNSQPRKAEIIMQKVRDLFREKSFNDNEYYSVAVEKENLYRWKDLDGKRPTMGEYQKQENEHGNINHNA